MSFSRAETTLPTMLAWHRSCGVPREGTVITPLSVACTPYDRELHMTMFVCNSHEHKWFSTPISTHSVFQLDLSTLEGQNRRCRRRGAPTSCREPLWRQSAMGTLGHRLSKNCQTTNQLDIHFWIEFLCMLWRQGGAARCVPKKRAIVVEPVASFQERTSLTFPYRDCSKCTCWLPDDTT
jgi:hypothetical protein